MIKELFKILLFPFFFIKILLEKYKKLKVFLDKKVSYNKEMRKRYG